MRNSIQHFIDFRITNLQESAKKFSQSPQDIAGFVTAVKDEALRFALDFIGETFTTCNDILRESPVRRGTWEVVRTDEKTLITSIGSVRYEKTLFKNKKSDERRYLLDAAMGIDSTRGSVRMPLRRCWRKAFRPVTEREERPSASSTRYPRKP